MYVKLVLFSVSFSLSAYYAEHITMMISFVENNFELAPLQSCDQLQTVASEEGKSRSAMAIE